MNDHWKNMKNPTQKMAYMHFQQQRHNLNKHEIYKETNKETNIIYHYRLSINTFKSNKNSYPATYRKIIFFNF